MGVMRFRLGSFMLPFDSHAIPCVLFKLCGDLAAGRVGMLSPSGDARCHGITKGGRRCSITARSTLKDAAGRFVGLPLSLGAPCCLYHAVLFQTCPVELGDAVVAYIDLETDSLDVLSGNIVEIGALVGGSRAAFSLSLIHI